MYRSDVIEEYYLVMCAKFEFKEELFYFLKLEEENKRCDAVFRTDCSQSDIRQTLSRRNVFKINCLDSSWQICR